MATILTKKKDTTGAPATGDLTNSSGGAELAVNTADKRLYTKNSSNAVVEIGTNPGTAVTFTAGTASDPAITTTGDTNTGIFFPAADTIAFAEGGAEAMRIDAGGNVGIGATTLTVSGLEIARATGAATPTPVELRLSTTTDGSDWSTTDPWGRLSFYSADTSSAGPKIVSAIDVTAVAASGGTGNLSFKLAAITTGTLTERMRITSDGNVGIGTTSPGSFISYGQRLVVGSGSGGQGITVYSATNAFGALVFADGTTGDSQLRPGQVVYDHSTNAMFFSTNGDERARITSGGDFFVGKTADTGGVAGAHLGPLGFVSTKRSAGTCAIFDRLTNDGNLVEFYQDGTLEGAISVSGNTVTYGAFCGGHWTQLKEGRGYNPDIPRGTVMSSIGEMAVWKSVEWTETIEHPAVEAVEAVEAVLDEDGNVIEPAIEAVEGKEAWTETFNKREAYLGNLDIGATFEEDGFTKTVVDDGNERLPKVKISDSVGDKAVYGVFQTWDEAQDMMIASIGAYLVRVASGVTVEVGDLLESNGDGCAKVQDDDIIRSKTIGKVTSTVATDTYDDGSYTVPCVLYCG
jgi:hypothetical protein